MKDIQQVHANYTKEKIKKLSKKEYRLFVKKFKDIIEDSGEVLFDTSKEYILTIFKTQGFWSGVKYYIFYDYFEKEFFREERVFGYNA